MPVLMARIEWAQLCELAFLDSCDRLCMVGITNRFPVPALPLAVNQIMIAARVVDVRPGEEFDVGLSVQTPNGLWTGPDDPSGYEVWIAGEYVLMTLRNVPLHQEGIYRFELSLAAGGLVTLAIPVFVVSKARHAAIH
jgi:hypothetical protein